MSLYNLHEISKSYFLKGLIKYTVILITCSIILSISACGGDKDEAPTETAENETTETVTPESTKATSNDISSEVQSNREKWMAHEISNYEIEMQKICYCVPEVVRMMVFEVGDNKVETVRYADTGDDVDPQHYGDFNTIEGMFLFVEQALEKNPADLIIAYDEEYGYIKELSVDFKENIADDEISIIASNMRPR
ncbi:MAG: hypothetical protein GKR92_09930 [Gammaproteobacteria bacterium]|nr:MAG: hypothetical protein GKR92_09930 [Gammaproteobacteria bacterium]